MTPMSPAGSFYAEIVALRMDRNQSNGSGVMTLLLGPVTDTPGFTCLLLHLILYSHSTSRHLSLPEARRVHLLKDSEQDEPGTFLSACLTIWASR